MVPAETVEVDCRVFLVLVFGDAVIGAEGLGGVVADPSNRRLKVLEEVAGLGQTGTEVSLADVLWFSGDFDGIGGWGVELDVRSMGRDWFGLGVGGIGEVIFLQQLLVEPVVLGEELLVLVGRGVRWLVLIHIILLREVYAGFQSFELAF